MFVAWGEGGFVQWHSVNWVRRREHVQTSLSILPIKKCQFCGSLNWSLVTIDVSM